MSSLEQIKKLREMTGAGIIEVKNALKQAGGDEDGAMKILRTRGKEKAIKKSDRQAREGVVACYVHSNKKVGAMIKLLCETDFVARNEEFQALAYDLAMQITASNPLCVRPEDVSLEILEKEREIWMAQLSNEGKPRDLVNKILEGKEKKFREEAALLTQPYIKNPEQPVGELIAQMVGKIGENIQIGEFSRFEL